MTQNKRSMGLEDLRVMYDLSIYNCLHFDPYTALIYEDVQRQEIRACTNVEIAREATQLAAGLRALGITKGDRVIVMMLNCPEVIVAYQAIARAGAIIIPVMPLLKAPEVHYIAQNSAARAIITSPILLPLLRAALADVPTMRYVIATGNEGTPSSERDSSLPYETLRYKDVVVRGSASAGDYLDDLPGVDLTPDDTAVILYTSGTTGSPKGVELTHRNVISNTVAGRGESTNGEQETNVQLAILPLAHAFGLTVSNVGYLSGTKFIMHPRFDTNAVLSAIERHHVNAFAGVPAMFVALLYTPDAEKYDTSSLRYCVSGSAPLPLAILEGFQKKFGCQILEGYGLSEATTVLTGHSQDMPVKPGSVGKPVSGVELHIVDDNDRDVPVGEVGEIIARGPNIMKGYYNMPDATATTLRNGWLHTGDMGRFDEDGYLYIVERKKDLIIRGGFNIYPRDVEEVLNSHPAVIESAVIGVPSERMGEEVKAFVVKRGEVDAETLKAYCREKLANYKTPGELEFLDILPRNGVGKIDKKELRKHHVN
ncbi:MAG TPA: long-chain fatty acid--CoA ligase [Ktedonobacteraceae bacterium]|nr:long-chain fatty acid--CoA ligase [Ktedonobacteraceae bacterium]